MKIDLPEEYVPLVIDALAHCYAYTRAKQHEDVRYQDAADWFKRKRPAAEPEPRGPGVVDDPVNPFVVTEFRLLADEKGLGTHPINQGSA